MNAVRICFLITALFAINHLNAQSNLALNGTVKQSSTFDNGNAEKAIDGDSNGNWTDGKMTHTEEEKNPFWEIDLGEAYDIGNIVLYNRTDCCMERLSNYYVYWSDQAFTNLAPNNINADQVKFFDDVANVRNDIIINSKARYIRVQIKGNGILSLAEIQIFSNENGRKYQNIETEESLQILSTNKSYTLNAKTSSGLKPSFKLLSGPAKIKRDKLIPTGREGTVKIEVSQSGNRKFSAANPAVIEIKVIDPQQVKPVLNFVSITEAYGLEMRTLKAFPVSVNADIDHPDFFDIEKVDFQVNETSYQASKHENGNYYFNWLPSQFGKQSITATAIGTNGEQTSKKLVFDLKKSTDKNNEVSLIKNAEIVWENGGQYYEGTATLPSSLDSYKNITAYLDITCPEVGCDRYDRISQIWLRPKGSNQWTEIIRYATPFGVPCDHSIEIGEYSSILQGEVEVKMFIETWNKGWKVNLNLTYEAGRPEYTYSKIDHLWNERLPFGKLDNLQPAKKHRLQPAQQTEAAILRFVSTGHGWGENNTDNAAEFRDSTHEIYVNDKQFIHHPWDECEPNPDGCQPQKGTWKYPRAGWCPGAVAKGDTYNLTPFLNDQELEFSLILDPTYKDYCSPVNPDCISGETCTKCEHGYYPVLFVASNVISFSNQIFTK